MTIDEETRQEMIQNRAKNNFVNDFTSKLTQKLETGLAAGTIVAQPAATPSASTSAAPAAAVNPAATPPGETPEQKRIRLQKAAQLNVDKTAVPFSKVPPVVPTPPTTATAPETPEQVRIRKQQAALAAVRESKFNKLNKLIENIINIDEQTGAPTSISDFVQIEFFKLMNSPALATPEIKAKVKELADDIAASYSKDKGASAIKSLIDFGWEALAPKPKQVGAVGTAQTTVASPSYDQAISLIAKLGNPEKQQLLSYLTTSPAKINTPRKPEKSSFTSPGLPSEKEDAIYYQRIAQAQAAQSK